MSSGSRHLARRSAVQALYQWELTGQSAAEIEPGFISDDAYSGVNRDYFLQLIENIPANIRVGTTIPVLVDRKSVV